MIDRQEAAQRSPAKELFHQASQPLAHQHGQGQGKATQEDRQRDQQPGQIGPPQQQDRARHAGNRPDEIAGQPDQPVDQYRDGHLGGLPLEIARQIPAPGDVGADHAQREIGEK